MEILIVIIAVGAVICLTFGLSAVVYLAAFGKRIDKNPLLTYYSGEDFNLSKKSVAVKEGKITLNGYIYRNERVLERDKLIIFCHGMGPGHIAYTTEIAYFCNLGYPVLALDIKGCNLSDGKSIKGIYEGVKCVKAAVDYTRKEYKEKGVYLVGHSWGGYSVLCAAKERKVEKVVAIGAPDTPVKTIYGGASRVISKPLAFIMIPFWGLINFFNFGAKGNMRASVSAERSGANVLLIHGGSDKIVNFKNSAYRNAEGKNITKFLADGKGHNPYNTLNAEKKLSELNAALMKSKKMTEEERTQYFKNFDYKAATEEDTEVMIKIAEFLEE